MSKSSRKTRRVQILPSVRAVVEQLEERRMLSTNGDYVSLVKAGIYTQTGESTPEISQYFFATEVDETSDPNGNITNGKLTMPDGVTTHNLITSNPSNLATYTLPFASSAAMDAAFPAGTYNVTFNDNYGRHSFDLSFGADDFPEPVQISNETALENADSTQDVDIQWNPLNGGNGSDFVQVGLTLNGDLVYESDSFGESGALNGTDTSFTIPAGTLQAGQTYNAHIAFIFPVTVITSDPNVDAASGYEDLTEFTIATEGATLPPPSGVNASEGLYPHHVQITWAAVSGATSYQVFRSTTNDFTTATKLQGALTTLSYNDNTATPGVLFYYWVRGRNPSGVGSPSTDETGYIPLAAPTLNATGLTHHIALTWTAVPGASGYQVFRSATVNLSDAVKIQSGLTSLFFNDTGVSNGTVYWYWVRARNSVGVGEFSNEVTAELGVASFDVGGGDFSSGTTINSGVVIVNGDLISGNGTLNIDPTGSDSLLLSDELKDLNLAAENGLLD